MSAAVCDREECQRYPEVIVTDVATGTAVTHSESHAWALLDVPAGSVTVERAPEPETLADGPCPGTRRRIPGGYIGHDVRCPECGTWARLIPDYGIAEHQAPKAEATGGTVTVALSCSYDCGRDWEDLVTLPAPPEGAAGSAVDEHRGGPWQLADWWDDVVRPRMGDGHRCGPHTCESYDEAVIRSAPGRPELADLSRSWQG